MICTLHAQAVLEPHRQRRALPHLASATRRRKNLFHDDERQARAGLSKLAYQFLGGLLEHARGLAAVCAPVGQFVQAAGRRARRCRARPGRRRTSPTATTTARPCVRIPCGRLELRLPDRRVQSVSGHGRDPRRRPRRHRAQARPGRARTTSTSTSSRPRRSASKGSACCRRTSTKHRRARSRRGVRQGARRGPRAGIHRAEAHGVGSNTRATCPTGKRSVIWSSESRRIMCGIVGLLVKKPELREQLGELDGADADRHDRARAGLGRPGRVHGARSTQDARKFSLYCAMRVLDWNASRGRAAREQLGGEVTLRGQRQPRRARAARLDPRGCVALARRGSTRSPRAVGRPVDRPLQGHRRTRPTSRSATASATSTGTHLVGHTRMATESAVTPAHAHPFTAGEDFCLVHNGSLSNPYSVRRKLEPLGIRFETDNDTEAACRFSNGGCARATTSRRRCTRGFDELDGFYTFLMGTRRQARAGARRRSPASRPWSPRPTTTWRSPPSSARWRICPASSTPTSSSRSRRRSTSWTSSRQSATTSAFDLAKDAGARAERSSCTTSCRARRRAGRRSSTPTARTTSRSALNAPVEIEIMGTPATTSAGMNQHAEHHGARQRRLERRREHDVGRVRVQGLRLRVRRRVGARRAAGDRRRCVVCAAASR